MVPDYREFLRVLNGAGPGCPALFEPFIPPYLTEQLIWRRGTHLWQEAKAYVETMLSLRERTYADIVCIDMRLFGDSRAEELLCCMENALSEGIRYVALCNTATQAAYADASDSVCALGIYGKRTGVYKKPIICMDNSIEEAIAGGAAGWFCPSDGETLWRSYGNSICILGGLGCNWVQDNKPAIIHRRCEDIFSETNGMHFAVGSGGMLTAEAYLSLISLLGIYRRYR